jgi:hypothetical protein
MKFFSSLIGMAALAFILIAMVRFVGPKINICHEYGKGQSMYTKCFNNLISFQGDGWGSLKNVKFKK